MTEWFACTLLAVEYLLYTITQYARRGMFNRSTPRPNKGRGYAMFYVFDFLFDFVFHSCITTYLKATWRTMVTVLQRNWKNGSRNHPKPPPSILVYHVTDPLHSYVISILPLCSQLLLDLVFCPLSCFASAMSRCCCTLFDRIGSLLTLISSLIATTLNTEFQLVHEPIETTL